MTEGRVRAFVSAQQVADRAGVSRSAVSRTFTDGASVSPATRRKVEEAAEALGYHVNHLARSLIHEDSGIVCLVAAEVATPHQARIFDALTRRLQAIGRVGMAINTSGDATAAAAALRQTLNYRAAATVVLSGAPPAALIDTCMRSGQQVILINRDETSDGPVNITLDNAVAAGTALDIFVRAGARRVAVVSSTAGTPSIVERETAFVAAAAAADIIATVVRAGPTGYAAGVEAGKLLLSGGTRPDAAFCVTDLLACGFMDAARFEFGMAIPDDIGVIGFDDIEQAGWGAYALTTFRQPVEAIADHIMALIESRDDTTGAACFHASPVWRRSVRPKK